MIKFHNLKLNFVNFANFSISIYIVQKLFCKYLYIMETKVIRFDDVIDIYIYSERN